MVAFPRARKPPWQCVVPDGLWHNSIRSDLGTSVVSCLVYHINKDMNVAILETSYLIGCLLIREGCLDKRGDFALEDGLADQALQRGRGGGPHPGQDQNKVRRSRGFCRHHQRTLDM
jgi:hypothetical protein